jgi:hypothetical protein
MSSPPLARHAPVRYRKGAYYKPIGNAKHGTPNVIGTAPEQNRDRGWDGRSRRKRRRVRGPREEDVVDEEDEDEDDDTESVDSDDGDEAGHGAGGAGAQGQRV